MVKAISKVAIDKQVNILVSYFKKFRESVLNDKYDCWIHKSKTIRQFVNDISIYYDLNVNSFYLKQIPSESGSKIKDQIFLVVDDDRLLSTIGIEFGISTQYNFILLKNDDENYRAMCYINILQRRKLYQIIVDKIITASDLYMNVLELCLRDYFDIENFVLTFNFFQINKRAEIVKYEIADDDPRLLCEIGVVFEQNVRNCFEVLLDNSSDDVDNNTSSNLCLPTQDQNTISQHSKTQSSIQNNLLLSPKKKPNQKFPKLIEYRGLINESSTCYLNSFLQALYMTPEFRNALYQWKFDFNGNLDPTKSIPFQLQKLFLSLQTSPYGSVITKELINSFSWNNFVTYRQQDIQELCRVLFDALENEFKDTTHADLIKKLYQGKFNDIIKCLECGDEKCKESTFLDIPLSIRPFNSTNTYKSITEALQGFVQMEILDGNNQYFCDTCDKKCDAQKSLKFTKFPYILTLHLLRFDFDVNTLQRVKLHDKVTFPLFLNLNDYITNHKNSQDIKDTLIDEVFEGLSKSRTEMDSSLISDEINLNEEKDIGQHKTENKSAVSSNPENEQIGPYMYELYAIMMHSGNASEGHYYAFIKDLETFQWYCFDDQRVSVTSTDFIERCYGGETVQKNSNNAYMLMYRQIDKKRNKIALTQEEFPEHLRDLHNFMWQKYKENTQIREEEPDIFPIPVHSFVECKLRLMIIQCNKFTTFDCLKTLAISAFEVTEPCQLVIFNTIMEEIVENLENQSDCYVNNLKLLPSCVFLLQIVDNKGFLSTSEDCNLSDKDSLATSSEDLYDVLATSNESINQCEDSSTESKRITVDADEYYQINSPVYDSTTMIYDHYSIDNNNDETEDNNDSYEDETDDNNENYMDEMEEIAKYVNKLTKKINKSNN